MQDYSTSSWFKYLSPRQQDLVKVSYQLLATYQKAEKLEDYGFVVFSMSKAYEGFIKKYLLDLNLIDQKTYQSRKFRIGRSLNPDINARQRDEWWLYDDVAKACKEVVARELWETWLECRNRVFHFFPEKKGQLSLEEAAAKLNKMKMAMEVAVACL
jgi:hypothetical protein